jgi:hypothetical protein
LSACSMGVAVQYNIGTIIFSLPYRRNLNQLISTDLKSSLRYLLVYIFTRDHLSPMKKIRKKVHIALFPLLPEFYKAKRRMRTNPVPTVGNTHCHNGRKNRSGPSFYEFKNCP